MAFLLTSPKGNVHEFKTLDAAVRTLTIATDELTKDDYTEILHHLQRNPQQGYQHNGWSVKTDLSVRGKGKPVLVTEISSGNQIQFDTIKQCAGAMGLKESFVSNLMKRANNTHQGFRFEDAPTSLISNTAFNRPRQHRVNSSSGW